MPLCQLLTSPQKKAQKHIKTDEVEDEDEDNKTEHIGLFRFALIELAAPPPNETTSETTTETTRHGVFYTGAAVAVPYDAAVPPLGGSNTAFSAPAEAGAEAGAEAETEAEAEAGAAAEVATAGTAAAAAAGAGAFSSADNTGPEPVICSLWSHRILDSASLCANGFGGASASQSEKKRPLSFSKPGVKATYMLVAEP